MCDSLHSLLLVCEQGRFTSVRRGQLSPSIPAPFGIAASTDLKSRIVHHIHTVVLIRHKACFDLIHRGQVGLFTSVFVICLALPT